MMHLLACIVKEIFFYTFFLDFTLVRFDDYYYCS